MESQEVLGEPVRVQGLEDRAARLRRRLVAGCMVAEGSGGRPGRCDAELDHDGHALGRQDRPGQDRGVHEPAHDDRVCNHAAAVVVERLPEVVLAIEQVAREPDRVGGRRSTVPPGVHRRQGGHVHSKDEVVVAQGPVIRSGHRPGWDAEQIGETAVGGDEECPAVDDGPGERPQPQRLTDVGGERIDSIPQRRPPDVRRSGHEEDPHPLRAAQRGVAQHEDQVVEGPTFGVVHQQEQLCAGLARSSHQSAGGVADVVGGPGAPAGGG